MLARPEFSPRRFVHNIEVKRKENEVTKLAMVRPCEVQGFFTLRSTPDSLRTLIPFHNTTAGMIAGHGRTWIRRPGQNNLSSLLHECGLSEYTGPWVWSNCALAA